MTPLSNSPFPSLSSFSFSFFGPRREMYVTLTVTVTMGEKFWQYRTVQAVLFTVTGHTVRRYDGDSTACHFACIILRTLEVLHCWIASFSHKSSLACCACCYYFWSSLTIRYNQPKSGKRTLTQYSFTHTVSLREREREREREKERKVKDTHMKWQWI